MAIYTVTSPSHIEEVENHSIDCPKCGKRMAVRNYFKKKKRKFGDFVLTSCICYNGCLNEFYEPGDQKEYYFVSDSASDAIKVREHILKSL